MITRIVSLLALCILYSCAPQSAAVPDKETSRKQIDSLLDAFNVAAAKANFKEYFGYYSDDAIFTGTDATERWNLDQFKAFAKPYFDKGKAWNFSAIERHIYFDTTGNTAWFDELLNTQMKVCRGSGVLTREGNSWKVRQYILSTTVPNNRIDSVVSLKAAQEDSIIASKRK